jgi:hypothetical protein
MSKFLRGSPKALSTEGVFCWKLREALKGVQVMFSDWEQLRLIAHELKTELPPTEDRRQVILHLLSVLNTKLSELTEPF